MRKIFYFFTITTFLVSLFFSCNKDTNPVRIIKLDREEINLAVGISISITATIFPQDATESTVTCVSNNSTVAQVSVEKEETYETTYLIFGKSEGTATITIASKNGIQATCTVNVIKVEPEMVLVEGGTFTMGGTDDETNENELPQHQVSLSSYKIAKYTVTQQQWEAVMGSIPSKFKGNDFPISYVSWDDAQAFIKKLNTATGKNYRLPTEAEWEYAARGRQSNGFKYSGSDDVNEVAWYDGNSNSSTHPVGTKKANELGIYDMSGNLWEYCSDKYGIYSDDTQTNPTGPDIGTLRVIRGGAYYNIAYYSRVSARTAWSQNRTTQASFRLVLP